MEARIREEVQREGITEEKARYILKKDDDERRRWGIQLYGMDPWECQVYDMVLHIKTITVDDAVETICRMAQGPTFRTTPASQTILDNLLLAAEVKAAVVGIEPMVTVTAHDGLVQISSTDVTRNIRPGVIAEIKAAAEGVPGVKRVIFSGQLREDDHGTVNPFHKI